MLFRSPPLGYVIELKPLGNFSHQEAEQLREELVKQLGIIFNKVCLLYTSPSAYIVKIMDGIYVPMTRNGIEEISSKDYEAGVRCV